MIIIRYDEISLKGQNRPFFTNALKKSVEMFFVKHGLDKPSIRRTHGRLLVFTALEPDWIKDVFGVTSYSFAKQCKPELSEIKKTVLSMISCVKSPFRVSAQRLDKKSKLRSQEIDREIGAFIVEKTQAKVSLKQYSSEVGIELVDGSCFVFADKYKGHGGYPVGTQGKALLVIDCPLDILAGILMMKRGCNLLVRNEAGLDIHSLSKYHAKEPSVLEDINPEIIKRFELQAAVNTKLTEYHGMCILNPLVGFTPSEIESLSREFL